MPFASARALLASGATPRNRPVSISQRYSQLGLYLKRLRKIVAACFWVYVVCKLFIFDIDIYLIQHTDPSLLWIARYKFFILIAIISTLLLTTRSVRLLGWILYILFFPLVLIIWEIPVFVFQTGKLGSRVCRLKCRNFTSYVDQI